MHLGQETLGPERTHVAREQRDADDDAADKGERGTGGGTQRKLSSATPSEDAKMMPLTTDHHHCRREYQQGVPHTIYSN